MADNDRKTVLDQLASRAANPTQEDLAEALRDLDGQILRFECRYNMSSDEIKRQIGRGLMSETVEFCKWLMLLNIRKSIGGAKMALPSDAGSC
jgi:hypothetical protein